MELQPKRGERRAVNEGEAVAAHRTLHEFVTRIQANEFVTKKGPETLRKALVSTDGVVVRIAGEPVVRLVQRARPLIERGDMAAAWRTLERVTHGPEIDIETDRTTFRFPGDVVVPDD